MPHPKKALGYTYQPALLPRPFLLPLLQVLHNGDLQLGVVVLVTVALVSDSLLRQLLVVHGVLRLVDRLGAGEFLHSGLGSLLANVKRDFGDVLDLSLDKLLVECGSRQKWHIHSTWVFHAELVALAHELVRANFGADRLDVLVHVLILAEEGLEDGIFLASGLTADPFFLTTFASAQAGLFLGALQRLLLTLSDTLLPTGLLR